MPTSHKEYDVFISFRGEDTRKNFTAQLHQALTDNNINTYIDYILKKGDEVGPSLAKAIKDSHISLVVFSENYATSKWCLDELLHILQCRELHGQVVIPVFCDVDPSHVRYQKESYQKAFAKYMRELASSKSHLDKVLEWKDALTSAANISGWDSRKYRDYSQVIHEVVADVKQKLSLMFPNELKNLVKVDEKDAHIELLLKTIPRIGIWGMSGIGKTTMAKQMFAKNFAHYDNVCFLENVSEESEKFGQMYVRNKLLSELLKREITASNVHGQHTFIKRRLSGKKSFIVLDDVDNATQLDDLCGVLDGLGDYSRVIITTRNKDILSGRVDEIYEVTPWELKDSLKLFSLGAFRQSYPREGYERVSERAVKYAGGVPLALKVLGSHFKSKKPKSWVSELNDYENKGETFPGIQKVLELSYNGLSWREKEMFLDIAFFFKDENKDLVTRILNTCDFNATNGVEVLENKALISISNSDTIQIHGLLQKMAFDIARQEDNDRGKRRRLKDAKDICDVLRNNKGIDAVEGIILDLSQKLDLEVQADTFNLMTELRFLKFHVPKGKKKLGTVHLPENFKLYFEKLAYLEWNGYPLKSLPEPVRAEQLIQICLPHSNIEHLWFKKQELVNLEAIDLSGCKKLKNLPDLSRAPKLKQLRLSGCEELLEVQASAFSKDTLVTLLLDGCKKLSSLMGEKHLKSLANFSVKGCYSLKEFSLSSDALRRLDLSNTGIKILHPSIGDMSNLYSLNLEGLNLTSLPIELSYLALTELRVSKCSVVTKSKLKALFDGLSSLTLLHLKDCCNLFELPANISSLSSLQELRLDGSNMKELPASIKYLLELEVQSLNNCSKLQGLPELPLSIKELQADNCLSLTTVSTLKTFSVNMIGQNKYISFQNSIKMELDGPSLACMTEDAMLTMKSAAFHNVLVRKYRFQTHSYNYNSAEVCLPVDKIPSQFKQRSSTYASLTVDIRNWVGFILAVVVTPSSITDEHEYFVGILCQCYSEDGRTEVGNKSKWKPKLVTDLKMDHIFVWYDPFLCDTILRRHERKVSFKFCITTYTTSGRELGDLLKIKECGVCPIYYSESQKVLGTSNLDKDLEKELYQEIELERSVEGYDEGEGIDIESNDKEGMSLQIQELDCLIVSKDTLVHDNPQEKENLEDDDNSKEMMKSEILHYSTSLKSGEKDSTEGSSDAELSINKEIKRGDSSGVDESHSSTFTVRLSLTNKLKIYEETKNLQQSVKIPSDSYTNLLQLKEAPNKLNPNSSVAAEGYDEGEGIDIEPNDKEGTSIQIQELDCLIASKDTQVHDDPQEKENLENDDNSKEMVKSKILDYSTSLKSREEDSTKGSSDAELSINKEIKRDDSSGVDESHSSTFPTRLSLTNKLKIYEETKNLQQSLPSLVKIPSHSYTNLLQLQEAPNKLNPNSSMAAESSSSKPSSSKGQIKTEENSSKLKKSSTPEHSPVDYSEYKKTLEEDPWAIIEKLLSDEHGSTSQASQSTTQAESTETQNASIQMLLDELRQLAFSRNLLKNLNNDVTLEEDVKALLDKLNDRANELSEKQSSGITAFTTIFNKALTNIDEEKRSNATLQQLNVDHEDSISKLQESKNKIKKFEESIIADGDKIKVMDVEIEDIRAQIVLLEEKAVKVQQEKLQLEDALLKCKENRSGIFDEAKNVASKTIQTREKIDNVKRRKLELDSNNEKLQEHYAIMRLSPPF
ncbi:disease resistance-like protein DSC1 [Vicia villosa]|uniref:disease resistance-like protein DSC1 n=1 Tax=Vicia villosa TaxID=3911 RepID=UPI00273C991B|nr:disease resistance-like protein DSC1 [Vicia villosa]